MKVLGIDPGIERLGWAVIEGRPGEIKRIDSGVKRTSKTKPKETRLFEIQSFVESKILEAGPEILCLEKIIFAKNAKTAFVIGEVRGILLALAGKYGLKTKEFTPIEVKKTISGYGRADKEAVLKMLEKTSFGKNLRRRVRRLGYRLFGRYPQRHFAKELRPVIFKEDYKD